MSIILTAGKKPLKKLKKEKPLKRPKTQGHLTVDCYLPTPNVVVWNTTLDSRPLSIAFCKESISVWCNDILFDTEDAFFEDSAELNFKLYNHKAQIRIFKQPNSKAQFITSNPKNAKAPRKNSEQVNQQVNNMSDSFNDLTCSGRKQSSHSSIGAIGTSSQADWDDGLVYELWVDGGFVPEKKMNKPCGHQAQKSNSQESNSSSRSSRDEFNF